MTFHAVSMSVRLIRRTLLLALVPGHDGLNFFRGQSREKEMRILRLPGQRLGFVQSQP